jgi:hypothetical protein
LVGKNDSAAATAAHRAAPMAWAASSTIGTPIAGHAAGRPNRWTGSAARVRGPTAAAAAWGSALSVASTSANTGRAPTRTIAPTVAKNDSGVVTISSPGPQPSAIAIASSASVPELVPTAWRDAGRRGQRPLEALDLGAADEAAVIEHPRDRASIAGRIAASSAAHVEERDRGHGSAPRLIEGRHDRRGAPKRSAAARRSWPGPRPRRG